MGGSSFVVTGGSRGVGRAIAERLALSGDVVVLDVVASLDWADPAVTLVSGDARDPDAARRAAAEAEATAPLAGWVNNAVIFRDETFTTGSADEVTDMIMANIRLAVTGGHTAVNHFLERGRTGQIVNVSSHQAQRPVRGALPYATAKAAIEGLTRAMAVDYGPDGIRTNAVALGSISTERYERYRHDHAGADELMAVLHPLGRVGRAAEVADAVAYLLSDRSSFINGAVVPVDGGRAVRGEDPEAG